MAERSKLDDPLNLMRVMPSKGARARCRTGVVSRVIFRTRLFVVRNRIDQEPRKPGREVVSSISFHEFMVSSFSFLYERA